MRNLLPIDQYCIPEYVYDFMGNSFATLSDILASVGLNVLCVNNVNVKGEAELLIEDYLPRLARLAGLSIGKMQRLYRAVSGDEQTAFTSAEIAVRSGLSPRSTDRALMRLENARLARVSGVRSGGTAGRPGRLWSFSFSV